MYLVSFSGVLREYTFTGNPIGRQLRWHPWGGHHGGEGAYWRVVDKNGDNRGNNSLIIYIMEIYKSLNILSSSFEKQIMYLLYTIM